MKRKQIWNILKSKGKQLMTNPKPTISDITNLQSHQSSIQTRFHEASLDQMSSVHSK